MQISISAEQIDTILVNQRRASWAIVRSDGTDVSGQKGFFPAGLTGFSIESFNDGLVPLAVEKDAGIADYGDSSVSAADVVMPDLLGTRVGPGFSEGFVLSLAVSLWAQNLRPIT